MKISKYYGRSLQTTHIGGDGTQVIINSHKGSLVDGRHNLAAYNLAITSPGESYGANQVRYIIGPAWSRSAHIERWVTTGQ